MQYSSFFLTYANWKNECENCGRLGQEQTFTYLDTVALARILLPQLNRFKLDTVAKALHINLHHHHRAVDDAECTAEIFLKFAEMLEKQDVFDLDGINELGSTSLEQIIMDRRYFMYQVIKK